MPLYRMTWSSSSLSGAKAWRYRETHWVYVAMPAVGVILNPPPFPIVKSEVIVRCG